MPEDIKIISSRRAYEFRPDDLRLTLLTIAPLIERIRDVYKFQIAQIGTPVPVFGPVPQTLPPGVVFNLGSFVSEESGITPIRFLHFEQRRIVIDIAAPSSNLDQLFASLATLLSEINAADGSPALGKPYRIIDASEISAKLSFPIESLLPSGLDSVFASAVGATVRPKIIVPTLTIQVQDQEAEYTGTTTADQVAGPTVQLALRQGTVPSDRVYFSIAPLDSDAHLTYLARLEQVLGHEPSPAPPQPTHRRSRRSTPRMNVGEEGVQ